MLICKFYMEDRSDAFVFAPGVNAPEGCDEIEVHLPGGVSLKDAESDALYTWLITPAENAGERDVYRVVPTEDVDDYEGCVPSPTVFMKDGEFEAYREEMGYDD